MKLLSALVIVCFCSGYSAVAAESQTLYDSMKSIYEKELGSTRPCRKTQVDTLRICSDTLRNEGNAPYFLHQSPTTRKTAVLFHGLSDSPYYMNGIAEIFFSRGYNVVVPLLPGHGLRDAESDMEDNALAERWQEHVEQIMEIVTRYSDHIVIGGFSTGGALATQYYLNNADKINGIALFSGALALSEDAEGMSNIWGIKLLAKLLDGEYQSHGPNPYKYPSVASFAGLELMDVIRDIRAQLNDGKRITVPIFAAHSGSDTTTPISGIESLVSHSDASNTLFVIDKEYQVCHADVVLNYSMLLQMKLREEEFDQTDRCAIPRVNPLFSTMEMMLVQYISQLGE